MQLAAGHSLTQDFKSLAYALLLHALVAAMLLANIVWPGSTHKRPLQDVIKAHVVLDRTAAPVRQEKKPAAPVTQTQDPGAAKRKAAELKKQAVAEKARKVALEKKRLQQQKQEAEKRRQAESREQLLKALAREERERKAQASEAKALSAMSEIEGLIRQRITRNWNRPSGTAAGLSCLVRVRLAAGGEVLGVTVVKSSGNDLFDRSVENAVYKAAPLPVPDDPELFKYIRELNINFDPED